jgi:hypothetical protein
VIDKNPRWIDRDFKDLAIKLIRKIRTATADRADDADFYRFTLISK